jgi:hypothetical protein
LLGYKNSDSDILGRKGPWRETKTIQKIIAIIESSRDAKSIQFHGFEK